MTTIFARHALLADGWANDVRLIVRDDVIDEVVTKTKAIDGDLECGIVMPGICNAHSHAFQRALAGHAESRSASATDTFWTWRSLMYRLASGLDAELLEAIAAQVYSEMLLSGYTSVVEFHYLLGGKTPETSGSAFAEALSRAADRSGIRLIYVPVLYERGDFDKPAPEGAQSLFACTPDDYLAHYEEMRARLTSPHRIGMGVHSLRAVSAPALASVAQRAAQDDVPMHLHIAEQRREVEACQATYGASPVRWLLDNAEVSERWALIHATHVDAEELRDLAASGATACVCPGTEGNLGDGFFPLRDFLAAGGSMAIGSDSHVIVNPLEELRWLEYGQRLLTGQRNVAALEPALAGTHTGTSLYRRAVDGGARAAGRRDGQLRSGAPADLVVLDDGHPVFAGHGLETLLDALVFSAGSMPIERVLVAGRWHIERGRHTLAEEIAETYRRALAGASDRLQLPEDRAS